MSDREDTRALNAHKIYVGGLNFTATKDDVADAFREAGRVVQVQLVTDSETGRSKGYAFVSFDTEKAYQYALDRMNGVSIKGRNVVVNKALSSEEKAAYDKERGIEARGRPDDRSRYPPSRGPPSRPYDDRPSGPKPKGYRVSLTGLPEHYTWRELKDFLRTQTGVQPTYAGVLGPADAPGPKNGVGEFPTIDDRDRAVRVLNGLVHEGCKIRCEAQADDGRDSRNYDDAGYGRADRGSGYADRGGGGGYSTRDDGYGRGGGGRDAGYAPRDPGGYSSRDAGGYSRDGYDADRAAPRGGADRYAGSAARDEPYSARYQANDGGGRYEPVGYGGGGSGYDDRTASRGERYQPSSRDEYAAGGRYAGHEAGGGRYEAGGGYGGARESGAYGGSSREGGGYAPREGGSHGARDAGYAPRDSGYAPREGGGYAARDGGGYAAPRDAGAYASRDASRSAYPPRDAGYTNGRDVAYPESRGGGGGGGAGYSSGREPAYDRGSYRGGGGASDYDYKPAPAGSGGYARPPASGSSRGYDAPESGRGGPDRLYTSSAPRGGSGYERSAPY